MSPALIQLFGFMTCTFALGLFIGWALWRYGEASGEAIETLKSEVTHWRASFEKSRMELWSVQEEHGALREEAANLKRMLHADR